MTAAARKQHAAGALRLLLLLPAPDNPDRGHRRARRQESAGNRRHSAEGLAGQFDDLGRQKPPHLTQPYKPEPFGAGEGIRTLDPDLGKVVLYP